MLPAGAAAGVAAIVVVAVVAATSGGSSTHSTGPVAGVRGGEYAGQGQNIQRITFSIDGETLSGLHGTFAVACASTGGSSYHLQTFVDPDRVRVGSDGTFADIYRFTVNGGAQARLTVSGSVSDGTATGHLQFAEPYCGTPLDGWAAALPGRGLPPTPGFTSSP